MTQSQTFYIGVMLELFAGIIGVFGKQLVSYGARFQERSRGRCFVTLGLVVTTFIGPIFDASAYGFAAQAIVAPLGGLDVVWNTMLAPCTLGEKPKWQHITGSLLIATGAVLTALFGPHDSVVITIAMLDEPVFLRKFLAYVLGFLVWLIFSVCILYSRPVGVGDKVRGFLLGITAGSIAGNMFFVSCAMALLKQGIFDHEWHPWVSWEPWVILCCAAFVALSNIPFMARGLQEYEAIFMVTVFCGSHIGVACFSGALLLDELADIGLLFFVLYWLSFLVICIGLYTVYSSSVKGIARNSTERLTHISPNSSTKSEAIVWASIFSGVATFNEMKLTLIDEESSNPSCER